MTKLKIQTLSVHSSVFIFHSKIFKHRTPNTEHRTNKFRSLTIWSLIIIWNLVFALSANRQGAWNLTYLYGQDSKEEEALFVAKKAFEDGFYDVSLGLLERFLRSYPNSFKATEVNLLIGQCYFHQNRFLDALAKFEELLNQAQAKDIKDAVLYWIAEVHFKGNSFNKAAGFYRMIFEGYPQSSYIAAAYYSFAWCLFQERKFEQALEYFKIVEEKYSKETSVQDVPFKIIECLYNLKDYKGLKEKLEPYLKLYSKDPTRLSYLYFYMAEADYYLNNFDQAIEEYSLVLKNNRDPKIQSLSKLGEAWSYLKLKRYKEAEDGFLDVKAEDLEKRSQEVLLLGKAILMVETNRVNEAKRMYDELLNASSDTLVLIQAYLGKADALYNLAEYADAINVYKEALNKFSVGSVPQEIIDKLHYSLSWAYLKQGEFKEAIKEFQKVVKETGDKTVKVSALCQIGDAYQDSGDYDKAQETYSTILKDYSDSFYSDYVQYQLGLTSLKSSNYEGAIMSFLALKRNFPESKLLDDNTYALGLAYFQRQDYDSSKAVFESFEREFKDSNLKPEALYLLGTSLYNLGKFTEAIEVFKEIIRTYSQNIELVQKAEYEIADCYDQMGDEKEAMDRFNILRSKYPDSSLTPEVMWWLGEYYYKHNELELARRYFFSLIKDFPKSILMSDAYYAIGTSFEEESKHEEAIENFKKVIELGKTDLNGQAVIAVADIYVRQNKIELAIDAYKQIIKDFPNLANLIYPKLADLFYKTENFSQALDYYRKSLDVVPVGEMASIQFKIAEVLQTQGKFAQAIEEYMKVNYLYSENNLFAIRALLRVAQIYEDQENFKEAISIYQRIISTNVEEAKYAQERIDWIKEHVK